MSVYFVTRIDVFPDTVTVANDTGGSVICYQRFNTNGHDFVQDAGRVTPGNETKVQVNSNCAVFDAGGRYVACLAVKDVAGKRLTSSSGDRGVSAETCVYPR